MLRCQIKAENGGSVMLLGHVAVMVQDRLSS